MASDIVFPDDITLPLRDSVRDLVEETRSKVQMEVGPHRIRRWNRVPPRVYELVWDMSQDEFETFDLWFQEVIRGGELPFDIRIQSDSGFVVWTTAQGIGEYVAECIDGYSWSVRWKVRTIVEPFTERIPTSFRGRARMGMLNQGELLVEKPMRGRAVLGVKGATARLLINGLGYNFGGSLGGI